MRRTLLVFLAILPILAPALAIAATDPTVAVDARVLTNATVERNGKNVGRVQRVMVNPTTGRIDHVDILMTEGASRMISVPWGGVSVYQNHSGNVMLSLTNRAAAEASPSTPPPAWPGADANISAAQQILVDRGYYSGPVDGVFGPATYAAVRAYQRDHGLRITGRLDAPTVSILNRESTQASAPNPYPSASYPSASPTIDIRTAQQTLRDRGYYSGPVDGVIGPATYAALRAYQRDHGLRMTGRLDWSTARRLNSDRGMASQS
jgi:peptidoglycan hydrolase-like protein with peptidoglycan-binding domain